jgi:hypothetical protein
VILYGFKYVRGCMLFSHHHHSSDVPDKSMCNEQTWFRMLLMENTGILHLDDDVIMCGDAACVWLGWYSARDLTSDL